MFTKNYYNAIGTYHMENASNFSNYTGNQENDEKNLSLRRCDGTKISGLNPCIPFSKMRTVFSLGTLLWPDTNSSEPSRDDYAIASSEFSSFTFISQTCEIESFDETTLDYTIHVTSNIMNTSGESKTVYGIASLLTLGPIISTNNMSLLSRDRFAAPVTVPASGTIVLEMRLKFNKGNLVSVSV